MWTAELERGRASREPRERAEAGALALAVIVGPEDGRAAGVRYNEQRSLRTGHWRDRRKEGRKNEAKPLQLPLFHPLARPLASNTTVDLGCKACRQCFHFR